MTITLCTNVATVQQHLDCDEDKADLWIDRMRAALARLPFVLGLTEEGSWAAWHAGEFGRGLRAAGHLPLGLVVVMAPSVATQDEIDQLWTVIKANTP